MTIDEVLTELGNREGYTRLITWEDRAFPDRNRHRTPREQADQDLERWSNQTGLSKTELFNQIGATIAVDYHEGRLSWEFGDMVVNELVGHVFRSYFDKPKLFWDVFLAFDAGETVDVTIEATTDPLIAGIVGKLRSGN